jgi:hypothetical protein
MYYLLQLTGFFLSLSVVHVSRQHISVQKHKLGCRLFFCFNGFCLFLEVLSRFCNWTVHVDHLLEHRSKCNSYEGRRSWSHRAENRDGMPPRFTPHPAYPRRGERGVGGRNVWKALQAEKEVVPRGAWRFLDALHRSAQGHATDTWYVLWAS